MKLNKKQYEAFRDLGALGKEVYTPTPEENRQHFISRLIIVYAAKKADLENLSMPELLEIAATKPNLRKYL